jgi:alkanesulfonate monooxygenase SsuD/methylene tetrahydromethanopterin reductase-like flavin-dependent oxidoreductase (luciferase family)
VYFSDPAATWNCCPGSENVRISIGVTNYGGAGLCEIVRAAGEAGVDTVWVTGHLIQADPNASPEGAMLEASTTLG